MSTVLIECVGGTLDGQYRPYDSSGSLIEGNERYYFVAWSRNRAVWSVWRAETFTPHDRKPGGTLK